MQTAWSNTEEKWVMRGREELLEKSPRAGGRSYDADHRGVLCNKESRCRQEGMRWWEIVDISFLVLHPSQGNRTCGPGLKCGEGRGDGGMRGHIPPRSPLRIS